MRDSDAGKEEYYLFKEETVVWVVGSRGMRLRNDQGLMAFESVEKATEYAPGYDVQELRLGEVADICHRNGLDIALRLNNGGMAVIKISHE